MTHDDLMAEVGRLAMESVSNRWGGPFGAVIVRDGQVVARGHNRVLLTGDPTAHSEIEAIRKAIQVLNPFSPTIGYEHFDGATLALSKTEGDGPERARMLSGFQIYCAAEPCPMCLAAIYWARLDACYYACDLETTRRVGFDDAILYEELSKPPKSRRLKTGQIPSRSCEEAYKMWLESPDRHEY